VQPVASPAALLSLHDGVAHDPYDHDETIADGLAGGFGAAPLRVAKDLIDGVLLATESELRQAVFVLLDREQLIAEPSGAIAIVPLLNGAIDVKGQRVVCTITGRNIDTDLLRSILNEQ
jgi:threonine dehydratase